MCGIFGWLPGPDNRRCDFQAVAEKQFQALAHRGPDDRGYALFSGRELLATEKNPAGQGSAAGTLLLGQTRLAIIDLSAAGHQPMFSPDGRYALVYNGEVYNYLELREELTALGARFVSRTDTEVVLQALIHWGPEALNRFEGMFALVLFDRLEGRLFCARDPFGVKPLFYAAAPDSFAFNSELPALMLCPGIERRLDWDTALDFLVRGRANVGGCSMVEGVRQLPPGHFMEVGLDRPAEASPRPYWRPIIGEPLQISFDEAAEELRRIFMESVRLHLRADVPLGVALSGGIDSSAVVCALRHLLPSAPIHAFSYVAAGHRLNEETWIDLAAGHAGATSHKVVVAPDEIKNDLDDLIAKQGEPFGSTSIYAQYRVFRLVRENGVVVTIDGQGADEALGGYFGYTPQRFNGLVRRGHFRRAARVLESEAQWPDRPALKSRGRIYSRVLREALRVWRAGLPGGLLRRLQKKQPWPQWIRRSRPEKLPDSSRRPEPVSGPYRLRETLLEELTRDGLPALLRHGDRNAMAFSVESRVPFCNRKLVEFALSLPEEYLVTDAGLTKAVFRRAMRGLVPDPILDRRDKIGFATPEFEWFKNMSAWVEDSLRQASFSAILDEKILLDEWRRIKTGEKAFDWRVWRWINYLRWKEQFSILE